jgi:hypothetical protein
MSAFQEFAVKMLKNKPMYKVYSSFEGTVWKLEFETDRWMAVKRAFRYNQMCKLVNFMQVVKPNGERIVKTNEEV